MTYYVNPDQSNSYIIPRNNSTRKTHLIDNIYDMQNFWPYPPNPPCPPSPPCPTWPQDPCSYPWQWPCCPGPRWPQGPVGPQ